MSSSSEEEGPEPKRRRGVTHKDLYKRNKIRNARVKGEAYINYKNNFVPQKLKPIGITCKCPKKCHSEISQNIIDDIWHKFYSLESKDLQDTYLQTLIEVKEIGRRRKKTQEPLPFKRNVTYIYTISKQTEY